MALADYQTLVDKLVRDDTGKIATADRDSAIELARLRYSKDRPQTKVEDLAGNGTNLLDLPGSWQAEFSKLVSLEYPIGDAPPTLIEAASTQIYRTPSGDKIMTASAIPAGQSIRTSYTIRQLLDGGNDTIPVGAREAVASYAAAILLDELAALFSGDTDSTMQADAVEHRTKAQEFAARARSLRSRYHDELGIDPKRAVAAGTVVALDPRDSLGNERLTHRLVR